MKLDKKQSDLIKEFERKRKAKQSTDFYKLESFKVLAGRSPDLLEKDYLLQLEIYSNFLNF